MRHCFPYLLITSLLLFPTAIMGQEPSIAQESAPNPVTEPNVNPDPNTNQVTNQERSTPREITPDERNVQEESTPQSNEAVLAKLKTIDTPIRIGEEGFRRRVQARAAKHGRDEPLGLILSGGGSHAFAHIGVLRELERENIAIDFIISNSTSSFVGMLYAAGFSPDTITRLIKEFPLSEYFASVISFKGGLVDQSEFVRVIKELTRGIELSETEIPIEVITEDLKSGRQVVFSLGDFSTILSASLAEPLLMEPVSYRNYTLIDGSVSNLIPIEEGGRYTSDLIVSGSFDRKQKSDTFILDILTTTLHFEKTRSSITAIKKFSPLLIQPELSDIDPLTFKGVDLLAQRGEEAVSQSRDQLAPYSLSQGQPQPQQQGERLNWDSDGTRQERDTRVEEMISEVRFRPDWTPRFRAEELYVTLLFGMYMYSGLPNDYYLSDVNYNYLRGEFRWGKWSFEPQFTVQLNLSTWGFDSMLSYQNDFFLTKNDYLVNFDWQGNLITQWVYTTWQFWAFRRDWFHPRFFATSEWDFPKEEPRSQFSRAGVDFNLGTTGSVGGAIFVYEADEQVGFQNVLGYQLSAKSSLPLGLSWLSFENEFLWRDGIEQALKHGDYVPLYRSDIYRGATNDLQYFNGINHFRRYYKQLAVLNSTLLFTPEWGGSLLGAMLFDEWEFGLFADYHYLDGNYYSVGGLFQFTPSLLGLADFTVRVTGGYDSFYKIPFARIGLQSNR